MDHEQIQQEIEKIRNSTFRPSLGKSSIELEKEIEGLKEKLEIAKAALLLAAYSSNGAADAATKALAKIETKGNSL